MERLRATMIASAVVGWAAAFAAEPPVEAVEPRRPTSADALSSAFRRATAAVRPSVVTVRTVSRRPASDRGPEAYAPGDATGVIVDRGGGVLTNFHAVRDAETASVELADGREFPVVEIRGDAWSDLALLKISGAGDLPEARFADPDRVEVGDWVVAAGNTFGLGFSASPGTVSAPRRELPDKNLVLLQTTAVANPGNSGGPLVDLRGDVVGICEGGYSVRGGFDGVSFAIPADVASFVARELTRRGAVRWPYLGIHFETLSPAVAASLGLPRGAAGVVVTRVLDGGPAEAAGVREGEVITSFDGRPVRESADLMTAIRRASVGRPAEVGGLSDSGPATHRVTPAALPGEPSRGPSGGDGPSPSPSPPEVVDSALGLTVAELPPAASAGAPGDARGVMITSVASESAARYLGLHPGAVVTHVGAAPVPDVAAYKKWLETRGRTDGVALLVSCPECGDHFFVIREAFARPPVRTGDAGRDAEAPGDGTGSFGDAGGEHRGGTAGPPTSVRNENARKRARLRSSLPATARGELVRATARRAAARSETPAFAGLGV